MAAQYRREGLMGLADGRWTPTLRGHPSVTPEIDEAIEAVHRESLRRSKISMRTKERLIHQYVREHFGPQVVVPPYTTLVRVWRERFGAQGARQRNLRSAAAVETGKATTAITRPGQVVVVDTTVLPVKVLDDVFAEPISVELSLALDAYTHSIVAFRLTPGSDSSIEVAMLLRDVLSPLPMRPGWGPELEWPYPGVPAALVTELAGYPAAARPFFAPETVTSDHGSVYKNHHLVQVARRLGITVLPARMMRPTDKAACERAFGGIRSLLLEALPGYTGVDVADRGVDPEADAVLTLQEMEHLLARWTVAIWQNRRLDQHAPAWDPGGRHSPNTLFAAAAAREGIVLEIPAPQLYYELLPTHFVGIDARRGVKVGGLWYDVVPGSDDVLAAHRGRLSRRSGRHRGKWAINRDPRDCRQVFFEGPEDGTWHALQWVGLPTGDVPAFSDSMVKQVLRQAARAGLKPHDDRELLPVLLELLAAQFPSRSWPTQLSKKERVDRARQLACSRSAAADRPSAPPSSAIAPQGPPTGPGEPQGAAQTQGRRSRISAQIAQAVDDDRHRHRAQTAEGQPAERPPRLGEQARRHSPLLLPAIGDDDQATGPATGPAVEPATGPAVEPAVGSAGAATVHAEEPG
ncbi:transposase [Spirillospora sp. CA-253888]